MVSIILPVYNGAACLGACLESIAAQSCRDWELLLLEDGSQDDSLEICREFAQGDPRVQLFAQPHGGVSAARNRGLAQAKGEYLLFVDGDDLLPPDALAHLLEAMGPNVDLVIGAHEEFRGPHSRQVPRRAETWTREEIRKDFARFDAMASTLWGKLYRRQIIQFHTMAFAPDLPYCEDHIFNLGFCKEIQEAAVTEAVVYRYRLGGVASSLQYHPNMGQHNLALLLAYQTFFDGQVPLDFWKKKVRAQLENSLLHELQCGPVHPRKGTVQKILKLYSPLLKEEPLEAKSLLFCLYRENLGTILKKRGKRLLWKWFHKRM